MPRDLGLSELARLGFAELTEARNRLVSLGLDANRFEGLADPDRALLWWERMRDAHCAAFDKAAAKDQWAEAFTLLSATSWGLAEFLKRRPEAWPALSAPLDAPLGRDQLVSEWNRDVRGLPLEAASEKLRVAYRRELCRLALWDIRHDHPIEVVAVVAKVLPSWLMRPLRSQSLLPAKTWG